MLSRIRERFARGRLSRRVAENAGWLLADRAVRLGLGFIVGVWVARYLGPHDFGQLSYAIALAGLFSVFVELALEGVVVRVLIERPGEAGAVLGTAFGLRMIGAMIALSGVCITAILLRPGDSVILATSVVVALTFLANPVHVLEFWYQARLANRAPTVVRSIAFFAVTGLRIAAVVAGMPMIAFAWLVFVEGALAAFSLIVLVRATDSSTPRWRWSGAQARALLKGAAPLILAGLATLATIRIDQLLIGAMLGDAQTGLYAAASRISETLQFVAVAVSSALLPAVIALKTDAPQRFELELGRIFGLMLAFGVGVALLVSLMSAWIVHLLFGAAYADSGPVLAIHAWTAAFSFISTAAGIYLIAAGLNWFAPLRMGAALLCNLLLNVVLLPRFGIAGAAWAAVASSAVAVYVLLLPGPTRSLGRLLAWPRPLARPPAIRH